MMIRIGIRDDSKAFLNQIKDMIELWNDKPQTIVTELFEDGDTLIQSHKKKPFDLLILDIVMPLLNGLDTAKEIRSKDKAVKIIFLSSSSEFAIDSYSVKASNYLLKPVHPEQLYICLKECIEEMNFSSKTLSVKISEMVYRIPLSSIEYVEAQNKHVCIHMKNGKSLLTSEPLYLLENKLLLSDGFYKCHRSYIVNIHHISKYSSKEVTMHSNDKIPISRGLRNSFETAYFSVLFGKAGENE
ncbi:MAG: response regulator transcription factor [Erysipelotrichaceae bacterium]|nr:response regulator transcription factor [Erysipelotrichaceae bacterium]